MKKVVLFGSIGIARECLEDILMPNKDIDIIGVCCSKNIPQWRNENSVFQYCVNNNIKIYEMSEIAALNADIGLSIRFDKIIPQEVIDSFTIGAFNTHGGILPNYRGTYSNINALLNHELEYGVTLHCIDAGIDTGDIIDIIKIRIEENDTGFDLYRKGEKLCKEILKKNITRLINNDFTKISQEELIKQGSFTNTYSIKKTIEKKEIKVNQLADESIYDVIRAFDSPFHEPAFYMLAGKKIYLTSKRWESRK